jgi:thiosulfate/3-mercaptopyruvate sulfurtransferase
MDSLVLTEWLQAELGAPDLRVIDATLFLPENGRDPRAEYEAEHIPGAVFLDLKEIADSEHPVPGMLPPEHKFASRMQSLGWATAIASSSTTTRPLHSSARAWWMLRAFGAHYVAILDGGLPKVEGGGAAARKRTTRRCSHARISPRSLDRERRRQGAGEPHRSTGDHESWPTRVPPSASAARSTHPRPGVTPGHIPGSKNTPRGCLFNPDNSWKHGDALRAVFEQAGVDLGKPLVTTSNSGVTAARAVVSPPICSARRT